MDARNLRIFFILLGITGIVNASYFDWSSSTELDDSSSVLSEHDYSDNPVLLHYLKINRPYYSRIGLWKSIADRIRDNKRYINIHNNAIESSETYLSKTSLDDSESRVTDSSTIYDIRSSPTAEENSSLVDKTIVTDRITKSETLRTSNPMSSDLYPTTFNPKSSAVSSGSYPTTPNLMTSAASSVVYSTFNPISSDSSSNLYPTTPNPMSLAASSDLYPTTPNLRTSAASSVLYSTVNPMSLDSSSNLNPTIPNQISLAISSNLYPTTPNLMTSADFSVLYSTVYPMSSDPSSNLYPTTPNPMPSAASSDLYPTTFNPMSSDASSNLHTTSNPMSSDSYPSTSKPIEIKTSSTIPNLESSSQGHGEHSTSTTSSRQSISNINTASTITINSVSGSTVTLNPNNQQATIPQDHIIKISSIKTARMIVSVIFIVVALVAASGLAVYIFTVKRRGVEYDQLLLLP